MKSNLEVRTAIIPIIPLIKDKNEEVRFTLSLDSKKLVENMKYHRTLKNLPGVIDSFAEDNKERFEAIYTIESKYATQFQKQIENIIPKTLQEQSQFYH